MGEMQRWYDAHFCAFPFAFSAAQLTHCIAANTRCIEGWDAKDVEPEGIKVEMQKKGSSPSFTSIDLQEAVDLARWSWSDKTESRQVVVIRNLSANGVCQPLTYLAHMGFVDGL